MEFPSYLLAYASALVIALLGILIVRISQKKNQTQSAQRRELIKRIESLPLLRIIQQTEISLRKLFNSTPLTAVHETVEYCESCCAAKRCKLQAETSDEISPNKIELCPVMNRLENHLS